MRFDALLCFVFIESATLLRFPHIWAHYCRRSRQYRNEPVLKYGSQHLNSIIKKIIVSNAIWLFLMRELPFHFPAFVFLLPATCRLWARQDFDVDLPVTVML